MDYVAGLLVVDTFNKKIAVVPVDGENKEDPSAALEKAFKQMGGKPEILYSDAEPGLTSKQSQSWLKRHENIAHNITLRHAPVAERMLGHIKNQIIHAMRGTDKKWWEVVDAVVKDYNENHVSRSTLMTPNDAGKDENRTEVKTQLESIKKSDNPQPRIEAGDKVRVIIKKKFEKGYMPDWSDEIYTVQSVSKGRDDALLTHVSYQPIIQRQVIYQLRDPNNTLINYKNGMYARSELLLVKKAHTLKEILVLIRSNVNKALIPRALVVACRGQDPRDLSRVALRVVLEDRTGSGSLSVHVGDLLPIQAYVVL